MKRLLITFLLSALVFSLTGCALPAADTPEEQTPIEVVQEDPSVDMPKITPDQIVARALDALKKGQIDQANEYFRYGSLITVHPGPFENHQQLLLSELEYDIAQWGYSSPDSAYVVADITTYDFEHLFHNEYIDQYGQFAREKSASTANWATTSADQYEIFRKAFASASKKVTNTVEFELTLVDDTWQIFPNDEIRAALAPGIDPFNNLHGWYTIEGMYNRLEAVLNPLDIIIYLDENDVSQDLSKIPYGFGGSD